jgi:hypothetical protein
VHKSYPSTDLAFDILTYGFQPGFRFHPEENAQEIHPADQIFVNHYDGKKRTGTDEDEFERGRDTPTGDEISNAQQDSLVQDVEGQHGFICICHEPGLEVQMLHAKAEERQQPAPGTHAKDPENLRIAWRTKDWIPFSCPKR